MYHITNLIAITRNHHHHQLCSLYEVAVIEVTVYTYVARHNLYIQ
jgi:hypothetical protein